jgi:two-component system, OmpR family, sensor histidine kinase BaeS
MSDYINSRLGLKLFLSYLVVILVGVIVLMIASQFAVPSAFGRHMMGTGMMMGNGQGLGQGQGAGQSGTQIGLREFRLSFFEALKYAAFSAIIAALAVGIFFSRRVIAPLRAVMTATQHISDGHYDERVHVDGTDEISQLAAHFNQMAEKLEGVESMRRRLIGDVAHELRTPLTVIKGSMEGLMDGLLPAPETYSEIHRETERLNRLVDDLQELSRVEARAYQLDIRPVDVSNLVATVVKRLRHQFDDKRVTLTPSLPRDPMQVLADEDRTIQILTNLLSNALQYTPPDGQVSLDVSRVGDEAQFLVKDTGIGIPPEHLAHIFDRFYRVDKSRSRQNGGGSGIGLTIAHHLVEAQGGRIWAESEGESKGSVFAFTLPLVK